MIAAVLFLHLLLPYLVIFLSLFIFSITIFYAIKKIT